MFGALRELWGPRRGGPQRSPARTPDFAADRGCLRVYAGRATPGGSEALAARGALRRP
jgi:hypothetical protein